MDNNSLDIFTRKKEKKDAFSFSDYSVVHLGQEREEKGNAYLNTKLLIMCTCIPVNKIFSFFNAIIYRYMYCRQSFSLFINFVY